jgi:hypothetical protein
MLAVGSILGFAMGTALTQVYQSTLETAAAECVARSNGTDTAVEDCYTSRRLELPQ